MITRHLETKTLLRATVQHAQVVDVTNTQLLLSTRATLASKQAISSANSEMLTARHRSGIGDELAGRILLEAVADDVLRVRYVESDAVLAHDTPMVVGTFAGPATCVITAHDAHGAVVTTTDAPAYWELRTTKMRVVIHLSPYRLELFDAQGKRCCGVGGAEKDYFCNWDAYNTGLCHSSDGTRQVAVESFDLTSQEAIYGFGEDFLDLNKRGHTIDLDIIDALGVTTTRSYKSIPFFVSANGYGVFFNHSSRMTAWVGSMSAADIQIAAEDDFLDYYIFVGDIKQVLNRYTDLTGKGQLPPQWTFGYWQSKISYSSAEETVEIIRQMRKHEIPCDVIHLDTNWFKADWYCDLQFDPIRFPDPPGYLAELASLGVKVSLWQLPYIPEGSQLFADLAAVEGLVKTSTGDIYNVGICFTPGFSGVVGVVDYTNPAAVRVHQGYFRQLFRMGAKVIKTDFGESAPLDGVYFDGTPGHQMHNLYPLLYNQAIAAVTEEETGAAVVWARSAWAGSQRFPLHWGGDNSPNNWNIAPQIAGGLSFGMSGFQFWSQDIGGFLGATNDELLICWFKASMFLSHSRIHGEGDRELYKFAPETVRICRDFLNLRYRLMPYIYGMARRCVESSLPMARPLVVEYQQDLNTWSIADEYLFGDSILVAPIFDGTSTRRLYLPEGTWTDWWTSEAITGGRWITATTTLETTPLYVREGAIIPLGPVQQYIGERVTTEIELVIAPFTGDDCTQFTIPINDTWIPCTYSAVNGKHEVTHGETPVAITVRYLKPC